MARPTSLSGDFVFRKGESIRELCFVVSGSLEVIQGGQRSQSVQKDVDLFILMQLVNEEINLVRKKLHTSTS